MKRPNSPTPISDAALTEAWPEFAEGIERAIDRTLAETWATMRPRCYERLLRGKVEYGDASFNQSLDHLIDEIQQEFLDAANWAFIAYCTTGDAALVTIASEALRGYAQTARVSEYFASPPRALKP